MNYLQQQQQQPKFRWTENLTCRFIQLRKEHGKLFTGRKYSAQAGWEYILRQMREEFPTIMADVHYRVLKKKWSNLLQQYKELKNPVHGDKNRADDISWPFYSAIDEVLGNLTLPQRRRRSAHRSDPVRLEASSAFAHNNDDDDQEDEDDGDEELLNPQEFLSVSVAPYGDDDDEPDDEEEYARQQRHVNRAIRERVDYPDEDDAIDEEDEEEERKPSITAVTGLMPKLRPLAHQTDEGQRKPAVFDSVMQAMGRGVRRSEGLQHQQQQQQVSRKRSATSSAEDELLSRLPHTTELTIRPIKRANVSATNSAAASQAASKEQYPVLVPISRASATSANGSKDHGGADATTSRRSASQQQPTGQSVAGSSLERKLDEFMEYSKRRDEENRSILLRMLKAMEDIRDSVR